MTAPVPHIINKHTFWLSPARVAYWETQQALIVSDLHFGKTGHFRKHGIAVPQSVFMEDMQRLMHQVMHFRPKQIIAVGDLFHSKENKEIDLFMKWRMDIPDVEFLLVEGNHDILTADHYKRMGIAVHKDCYQVDDIAFMHDPEACSTDKDVYTISGHLHPGVLISGLAKQQLRFPCFYFGKKLAVLPAFSNFSGLSLVDACKTDDVYAIVNQSLIKIVC